MIERLRGNDALSWAAIGLAGGVLVLTSLLTAFEIGITAYIGAGGAQRSYRYERELALVRDLRPLGVLPLAAGLAVVAAALLGLAGGARWWPAVTTLAVAIGLMWFALDTNDRLRWSEGVIGYEEPHGGPLLQPALDDLKAAARRSPEANDPGWTLLGGEHGYASRGTGAWRLFGWATVALAWLAGYRVARLRMRPWPAGLLVAVVSLLVVTVLALRGFSRLE